MTSSDKAEASALPINVFKEELKKECFELYQKLNGVNSEKPFSSEKDFLEDLKKLAPDLYKKLEKANFKFKLDETTRHELESLVNHSREVISQLDEKVIK